MPVANLFVADDEWVVFNVDQVGKMSLRFADELFFEMILIINFRLL
jgi:hypothetical protein